MQTPPPGNDTFTQPELFRIAKNIPGTWDAIARLTKKFDDLEITNIRLDISCHDNVQKATRMLNDYKKRLGSREALAHALEEMEERELAGKVRSKYYQNHKCDGSYYFKNMNFV